MATRFLAPYGRGLRTYDPLLDLHREMNRLFDDVFSFGGGGGWGGSAPAAYASAPRLDIHESDQELTVEAELPGVDRADLDVRLDGDLLTISGEKRTRRDDKQHNAHLSECSYGRFQRSVQLPFRPEANDVQAEFDGGVLKLRMPKRPEVQEGSRRIEVKEGQRSLQGGAAASASGTGGQAMTSAMSGGDKSPAGGKATAPSSSASASKASTPEGSSTGR